jgi:hypothetical protein
MLRHDPNEAVPTEFIGAHGFAIVADSSAREAAYFVEFEGLRYVVAFWYEASCCPGKAFAFLRREGVWFDVITNIGCEHSRCEAAIAPHKRALICCLICGERGYVRRSESGKQFLVCNNAHAINLEIVLEREPYTEVCESCNRPTKVHGTCVPCTRANTYAATENK